MSVEPEPTRPKQTWKEEIEVTGDELVTRVKELIEDATVSRVIIRKPSGETLLEVPVAAGAAVAGALTLFAPVLAAVGALAALIAKVRVEIVHEDAGDGDSGDSRTDA